MEQNRDFHNVWQMLIESWDWRDSLLFLASSFVALTALFVGDHIIRWVIFSLFAVAAFFLTVKYEERFVPKTHHGHERQFLLKTVMAAFFTASLVRRMYFAPAEGLPARRPTPQKDWVMDGYALLSSILLVVASVLFFAGSMRMVGSILPNPTNSMEMYPKIIEQLWVGGKVLIGALIALGLSIRLHTVVEKKPQ